MRHSKCSRGKNLFKAHNANARQSVIYLKKKAMLLLPSPHQQSPKEAKRHAKDRGQARRPGGNPAAAEQHYTNIHISIRS